MPVRNYYVATNDSKSFPRFMLTREGSPILYWTGSDWSEQKEQAALYADPDECLKDMQAFRVQDYGPCIKQAYEVPFTVEVYSHQAIDLDDLKSWLNKSLGFYVDSKTFGDGPKDSLVVCILRIHDIHPASG